MSSDRTLMNAALSHLDLAFANICDRAERCDVLDDERSAILKYARKLECLALQKQVGLLSNGANKVGMKPPTLPIVANTDIDTGHMRDVSKQVKKSHSVHVNEPGVKPLVQDSARREQACDLQDTHEDKFETTRAKEEGKVSNNTADTAVSEDSSPNKQSNTADTTVSDESSPNKQSSSILGSGLQPDVIATDILARTQKVKAKMRQNLGLGFSAEEVSAKQEDMLKILMDSFEELDKNKTYAIHHSKLRDMSARLGCHRFHIHNVFNEMERTSDGLIYQEEWHCIAKKIVDMHSYPELVDIVNRARAYRAGRVGSRPNSGSLLQTQLSARIPSFPSSSYTIISFQSRKRMVWDMAMMVLLCYVAMAMPLTFAYDHLLIVRKIDEAVDYLFMCDLVLNFRTTFLNEQREEVWEPRAIAMKYLRSWFLLDFVSCFPLEQVSAGMFPGLQPAKLLKVGKVAKAFKIVRISKMIRIWAGSELMDRWEEIVWSNNLMTVFRGMKLLICLLVLAHWFSCMLLACGFLSEGDDAAYTYYAGKDVSKFQRYGMAFYWAVMTMTTVGYGDVPIVNDWERLAAIVAMIIGGAFYGFIIGSVTTILSEHDLNQRAFSERMDIVVDWLNNHCELPPQLRRRIWRHFKQFLTAKKAVEDSIILNDLPPQLCSDVSQRLLKDSVRQNKIFDQLSVRACSRLVSALTQVKFQADEVVVNQGDTGKAMFIVDHGFVHLHKDDKARQLCPGDSFGEEILLRDVKEYGYTVKTHSRVAMFRLLHDDLVANFSDLEQDLKTMRENYDGNPEAEHEWVEASSTQKTPPQPPSGGGASLLAGGASGIPPSFPDTVFERFNYLMHRIDRMYSSYMRVEEQLSRLAKSDEALSAMIGEEELLVEGVLINSELPENTVQAL